MLSVPDIKLTRTDTTHDLSQKAEKRCLNKKTESPQLRQKHTYHPAFMEQVIYSRKLTNFSPLKYILHFDSITFNLKINCKRLFSRVLS